MNRHRISFGKAIKPHENMSMIVLHRHVAAASRYKKPFSGKKLMYERN